MAENQYNRFGIDWDSGTYRPTVAGPLLDWAVSEPETNFGADARAVTRALLGIVPAGSTDHSGTLGNVVTGGIQPLYEGYFTPSGYGGGQQAPTQQEAPPQYGLNVDALGLDQLGGGGLGPFQDVLSLGPLPQLPPLPAVSAGAAPDMTAVTQWLERAAPGEIDQEAYENAPLMGILGGLAQAAGNRPRNVGEMLLDLGLAGIGGAAEGMGMQADLRRQQQEDERAYAAMRAKGAMDMAEMQYEHQQAVAAARNEMAKMQYDVALRELEMRQPQIKMTEQGVQVLEVGPDGQRHLRVAPFTDTFRELDIADSLAGGLPGLVSYQDEINEDVGFKLATIHGDYLGLPAVITWELEKAGHLPAVMEQIWDETGLEAMDEELQRIQERMVGAKPEDIQAVQRNYMLSAVASVLAAEGPQRVGEMAHAYDIPSKRFLGVLQ